MMPLKSCITWKSATITIGTMGVFSDFGTFCELYPYQTEHSQRATSCSELVLFTKSVIELARAATTGEGKRYQLSSNRH